MRMTLKRALKVPALTELSQLSIPNLCRTAFRRCPRTNCAFRYTDRGEGISTKIYPALIADARLQGV